LKNEEIEIVKDDEIEEAVLINDVEVINNENDPEKVTIVKKERKCNTASEGEKVIAKGKEILKSNPKTKESGSRSWFGF